MQHLLLLHGAIGSSAQLNGLARQLKNDFTVHTLNFSGHGGNPVTQDHFSIVLFANDVLHYLDEHNIQRVNVFGYSMGGYVGLYLAKHHSERVNKVATLATKFDWTEAIAAREIQMLNPDKINEKLPAFAETLRQRHLPTDWKQVLTKTADMMTTLGTDNTMNATDYATIEIPVMILLGDRDKMVGLDETLAVFRALPKGQLGVLPCTPHPIEQVNTGVFAMLLKEFFLS